MPTITIQGNVINFPNSGSDPNWAENVIDFAQAVEQALQSAIGTYDIAPQVLDISAQSDGSFFDITNLAFPVTNVRGAFIRYAVYRETTLSKSTESGNLILSYNPDRGSGLKWEINRDFSGDASVDFQVSDAGQVQLKKTTISGSGHSGKLTFAAQALVNS